LPWADYAEEACVHGLKAFSGEACLNAPLSPRILRNMGKRRPWLIKLTDATQTLKIIRLRKHSNASLSYEISKKRSKGLGRRASLILPMNGQILDNPYYGDQLPNIT
jgi:hypothetical protein